MSQTNIVKGIKYGTWAKYAALTTKDIDTLYFITDKGGTIYKGSELVIPKNVIETVTTTGEILSKTYHTFEIELFNENAAGSTSSPTAPTKLTFSVYNKETIDAIQATLSHVMDTHRIISRSGSGTEQDPYVYVYADGKATDTDWGHVVLTDTVDLTGANNPNAASGGTAVTPAGVYNAIQEIIGGIGGAMVFKGTIGVAADNPTITSLPTNQYEAGWTYRVVTAGTYASQACEIGDLIIAINDGPASGSTIINADWTVAQNNIDGAVTAENTLDQDTVVLGNGNKTVKKLANGIEGQYLRIEHGVPTWVNHPNSDHGIAHCYCRTATDTAEKAAALSYVQIDSYVLQKGAIIAVKFEYDVMPKMHNPAGAATLNVALSGAKPIVFRGVAVGDNLIAAGDTATLIYDGTSWNVLTIDKELSGVAESGSYDDLFNKPIHYVTNSENASVTARTAIIPDFTTNCYRIIIMKVTNGIIFDAVANPTLTIKSDANTTTLSAKEIRWHGDAIKSGNIQPDDTVTMIYDGSQYFNVLSIDRKIDTTPVSGSTSFVTSGGVYSAIQ